MKNKECYTFFLYLLISVATFSQTTNATAINKLITQESTFFYNRDFKGWSSCYIQTDKCYWSCIEKGDVVLEAISWKNVAKFVGDYIAENPTPLKVTITRTNYKFTSYGNAVWLTFDEVLEDATTTKKLRGVRIVKKQHNKWKIVYMNSYPQPNA